MENKKGRFTGIVKRWDPVRGYGFLSMLKKDRYQAQDSLIFIHRNEIKEEYKDLHEQQVVHFDLYENHINANKVDLYPYDAEPDKCTYTVWDCIKTFNFNEYKRSK